ncbi:MAG: hypothetical protein ACP5N7_04885 [Candidatus Pacearchaeota archaeon]
MNLVTNIRASLFVLIFASGIILSQTSCATIMGGKVDTCQRSKPKEGGQTRKVRAGYLIADALFGFVPLVVDFATNAIYKPCPPVKGTVNITPTSIPKNGTVLVPSTMAPTPQKTQN